MILPELAGIAGVSSFSIVDFWLSLIGTVNFGASGFSCFITIESSLMVTILFKSVLVSSTAFSVATELSTFVPAISFSSKLTENSSTGVESSKAIGSSRSTISSTSEWSSFLSYWRKHIGKLVNKITKIEKELHENPSMIIQFSFLFSIVHLFFME